MTWGAVGITALSVVGGSLFGGGSKKAERSAKDAAAKAQFSQEQARRQAMELVDPYTDLGRGASRKLAELLGVAEPEGYAKRPELQDFEDQLRDEHFRKYGKDYGRNSNVAGQTVRAKKMYNDALQQWESGREDYLAKNPGSRGDGGLLKSFTNEDFVKDPGYEFRQAEGEKGINRALAARGGFNSGAALKALDRYNQDYASNEFSNAFNRDAATKARTFSFLSGASGQGLQAAGAGINAGQNAANNNSQIQSNLGNNLAGMYQQNADNQSNMFQSAIANGIYAYERNKPVTGSSTVPSGGYSSTAPTYAGGSSKPWYLS
ncbi:MAG: hypothetical protein CTY33_00350 [Methylotenera sp.]|nr:MAG: hypothetical protein CTY33_00350 [Methylotenera sp.]